ncbi:hypothetical protein E2C01_031679 [Portunus trituberculatus]|uniref:Uncharacterized protein n=1 Tax=Portunus trituberculatus TaxID=210409 RepID=A0A5B7EXI5_PORTR|nr:hypothetical protein [Portunus trituberculatus]
MEIWRLDTMSSARTLYNTTRIPQSEGASGVLPLPDGEELGRYYADFPWNDYCFHVRDPSLCAELIMEVTVSGMKNIGSHGSSIKDEDQPETKDEEAK